jgi:transcription elongation GreA/GreB family factor
VKDGPHEEVYVIVPHEEADPARGRISAESPMGRALIGHRKGDSVNVRRPENRWPVVVTHMYSERGGD